MQFNLITNLNNGVGLQRDFELLREELISHGHQVRGVQFNGHHCMRADINIFLETVVHSMFHMAPRQWVIPNPEWWLPEYHQCLPQIEKVFCKTQDSLQLFMSLAPEKVSFLGFLSRDLYRPHVQRLKSFLHVAGNSIVKNTGEILTAWELLPYHLTLVTRLKPLIKMAEKVSHVTVRYQIPDDELSLLMNQAQFHLCPSQYEGFGHYLHEGMGCGAIVITGDGPPMNEFGTPAELLLPTRVDSTLRLAQMRKVEVNDIVHMSHYVMSFTEDRVEELSERARMTFEADRGAFRGRLSEVLQAL